MSGLQLADGQGSGSLAQVRNNRLSVDADIHSTLEEHSEKGDAYSWSNVTYAYTAADTIIGIRNTSPDLNLYIDRIYLSVDTTTVVTIHRVNGSVALAGTAISAVNLNGTSGQVAPAEAKGDETTNSSQGDVLLQLELPGAETVDLEFQSAIILGPNDSIGIDYVTASGGPTAHITIFGFFNVHKR